MPHGQNQLLGSLSSDVLARLKPHLKVMEMVQGHVIYEAGQTINRVYFLHSGAVSLVVELQNGEMIEAAMVGKDSIVGGASALNGRISLCKALVQVHGSASSLEVEMLREVARNSEAFRTSLIRHEQVILAQAQQSAACNAAHTVEARLARWLLRTRDLTGGNALALTQEFLAEMLGGAAHQRFSRRPHSSAGGPHQIQPRPYHHYRPGRPARGCLRVLRDGQAHYGRLLQGQ